MNIAAFVKRISLFMVVNILVVATISILLKLFGIGSSYTPYGLDYQNLLAYCLIWGMAGSLISLALSRIMAKMMMGVAVIGDGVRDPGLQALRQTVYKLARAAQLPVMPEVGVYQSAEVNAFATGPTRSRALVAVSSGLLDRMNTRELEGVLAHEITHIANGDMVTMTLLQGVVNAFALFLSRVISFAIAQSMRGDRDQEGRGRGGFVHDNFLIRFLLEMVFTVLGSMVIAAFSRYREYRADAGGARLAGRESMIQALTSLQKISESAHGSALSPAQGDAAVQALKISGQSSGFLALFATHPPLEVRIARLRAF